MVGAAAAVEEVAGAPFHQYRYVAWDMSRLEDPLAAQWMDQWMVRWPVQWKGRLVLLHIVMFALAQQQPQPPPSCSQ